MAIFCIIVAATATAAPVGQLLASSLEATGPNHTTADLAGLFIEHHLPSDRLGPATFHLDAHHIIIEQHHALASVFAASRYSVTGDPERAYEGRGVLNGTDNRPSERVWVLPLSDQDPPTFTASAPDCTTLQPPPKDTVMKTAQVNNVQPIWRTNTTAATTWRTCQDATATLQGDFLLVLWERDADLTTPDGTTTRLRTGHHDAHPGTPIDGTVGTADELFITVHDGTLTLPLAPDAYEVYLNRPRVDAEAWRFVNAAGTLPGVVDAVEGDVDATGDLAVWAEGRGAGKALGIVVEGVPSSVGVDGKPMAVAAPVPDTS